MIDIRTLRNDPEKVKQNCARRGVVDIDVDALCDQDRQYRQILSDVEGLRNRRNLLTKECQHNPEARTSVKELKVVLGEKEEALQVLRQGIDDGLARLPNFLADDVPDGADDRDNEELTVWREARSFSFEPLDHQALGDRLDIIDTQRGSKVAQAGFYFWKGKGAELATALFFWTQRQLIKRGFTLFMPPCAAKEQTLFGTGYLPFFADQTYEIKDQDLLLIGTSEQALVAYHGGETLPSDRLPLRYAAFSPCFRTEAGSYGRETRGIFRVHQFHKVEQIVFCLPEDSDRFHRLCLENEEYLMQALQLPYRVVNVCVGDLGAPGYKKFDLEVHFPGYKGYREVCSNTNLTDFQARRLDIRYTDDKNQKGFVHTISATAVTDRVACAILENYQQEDGSVLIPEVLQPYTEFDRIDPE